MMMVFNRHFRKLFKCCAVLACVLHTCFSKNSWHRTGTQQTLFRDTGTTTASPKQTSAHLLNTHSQDDIIHTCFDRHPGFTKCGCACCTCVGTINNPNTRLANFLQDTLTYHSARLAKISTVQGLHVFY